MDALRKVEYYTVAEWLSWDESVRAEIHDGELVMMAPPLQRHQSILGELLRQVANFLKGKPCKVFPAPFGVRLSRDEDTAFEPDLVVVCDKSKLNGKICDGAPDMVVEILSPSTARIDRVYKFNKYLEAGVREYWMIDPDDKTLHAFVLKGGEYVAKAYDEADTAPVYVLEGCEISLTDVFAE